MSCILLKFVCEIEIMCCVGGLVVEIFWVFELYVQLGVMFKEFDWWVEEFICGKGVKFVYLGYGLCNNFFFGIICVSVNEVICYGIFDDCEL